MAKAKPVVPAAPAVDTLDSLAHSEWQVLFSAKAATRTAADQLKAAAGSAGAATLRLMTLIKDDVTLIEIKEERRPTIKTTASAEKVIAIGIEMARAGGMADKTVEDVQALIRRFARMTADKRAAVLTQGQGKGLNALRKVFLALEQGATGPADGEPKAETKELGEPELAELLASVTKHGTRETWLSLIAVAIDYGVESSAKLVEAEMNKPAKRTRKAA